MAAAIDPELLEAFLAESSDGLEQSERWLLDLERQPHNEGALRGLVQLFHTLKGAAAAVGLSDVATHLHYGESLLQDVLSDTVEIEPSRLVDFLFRFDDTLKELIAQVGGVEVEPATRAGGEGDSSGPAAATAGDHDAQELDPAILRVPTARVEALLQRAGELLAQRSRLERSARTFLNVERKLSGARRRLGSALEVLRERGESSELFHGVVEATAETRESTRELSHLVRELGLQLTQMSQMSAHLQRQITRLRLVPLHTLFHRLAREARAAAAAEGKQVEIELHGGDVQTDRLVADALYPALLQLVRNAVAHGIELPEERELRGKSRTGRIRIAARPRASRVVFDVTDDGAGLNDEAILAKARAHDLVPPGSMPRREQLLSLIFRPGFSTADSAGATGARGIGLDQVAREVAALKGTVGADSAMGNGTTFQIAVPATASIEEVVFVEVGQQLYALPTDCIEQSQLLDGSELEGIRRARTYGLRGEEIPALLLAPMVSEPIAAGGGAVIVLRARERMLALVVQRVRGREDVIVRPLGRVLAAHPFFSGATVSASGQVIFVINGLRLFDVLAHTARAAEAPEEPVAAVDLPLRGVLLVDDSKSIRKLASQFLSAGHFDTETAFDGVDALDKLVAARFRVVVTDLEMPRLHGYELLAAIKRDPRWSHLPVIVCTSRSSDEHRRRAFDLGADGYITKPFTREQLCREVERVSADAAPAHDG